MNHIDAVFFLLLHAFADRVVAMVHLSLLPFHLHAFQNVDDLAVLLDSSLVIFKNALKDVQERQTTSKSLEN